MKSLFFKIIIFSCILSRYIESSEAPQSSKQDSQQAQVSPRFFPFVESLASPNDFLKPIPSSQKCWKKFNNTDYKIPALLDVAMRKKAAFHMALILAKNPDLRTIKTETNRNIFHQLAEYGPAANMRRIINYCKTQHYDLATLINEHDNLGVTPAHLAAKSCKTHCLKLLMENGANLDAQDSGGDTPLNYAQRTRARGNKKRDHTLSILS